MAALETCLTERARETEKAVKRCRGGKSRRTSWGVPCTLRVYGPGLDLLEVEEIQVSTALSEEDLARRQ